MTKLEQFITEFVWVGIPKAFTLTFTIFIVTKPSFAEGIVRFIL